MKEILTTLILLCGTYYLVSAQSSDSISIEQALEEGLSLERKREYETARKLYLPLVQPAKQADLNNLYAKLLRSIGVNYFRNYKLDSAIIWLEKLQKEDSLLNFTDYGTVYSSFTYLGQSYSRLKRVAECIATFKKSVDYAKKVDKIEENDVFLARAYHNTGVSMEEMGDMETALIYLDSALYNLRESLKKPSELEAHIYSNKGNIYKKLGYFEEAITFNEQQIDLFETLPQEDISNNDWGLAYWYLGSVYQQRNASESDHYTSLKYAKISENYFLKVAAENPLLIYSYYMYAESYLQLGDFEKSLFYIELAEQRNIEIYGSDFGELGYCYMIKAKIAEGNNDLVSALAYLEQEIELYVKLDWKKYNDVAEAWYTKGNLLLKQQKPAIAMQAHQQALQILIPEFKPDGNSENTFLANPSPEQLYNNGFLFNALQYKAEAFVAYYEQEQKEVYLDKAVNCFELAYSYMALSREEVVNLKTKAAFSKNKFSIYEKGIEAAFMAYEFTGKEDYLLKAAFFADLSKSNNLLDKLQKIQQERSLDIPAELLKEERQALSLVGFTEKELYDAIRQGEDSTYLANLETQLFKYKLDYEAVIEDIRKQYPEYYLFSKSNNKGLELRKLMEKMPSGQLYISYFSGENNLYAFAFDNEKITGYKLAPLSNYSKDLNTVLTGLKNKVNQGFAVSALSLYDLLLKAPLTKHNRIDRITIIPDAEISYLPFDLLLSAAPTNQLSFKTYPFLIKEYEFSYHYSLNLVDFDQYNEQKSNTESLSFLGFAPEFNKAVNPLLATRSATDRQLVENLEMLPGALEEVKSISDFMNGEFITGSGATEEAFKQKAKNANFLHLATHTIIDDENPLYSKLIFSQNNTDKEDGLLYTYELFNLDLNANMVSLSACNTGTGKYYKGEGMVSLASGFMYAGVPNVMMTTWAVPDASTSTIMQAFYKEIKNGKSKAAALRDAKLAYIAQSDENLSHPYYWGAFMMIGNDKVAPSSNNTLMIVTGLMVVVLLIGIGVRKKIKKEV